MNIEKLNIFTAQLAADQKDVFQTHIEDNRNNNPVEDCAPPPWSDSAAKEDNFYYHIPVIAVTARGTVLAFGERRNVNCADWGDIRIELRRSADGGRTWEPLLQIVPTAESIEPSVLTSPPKPVGQEHIATYGNPVVITDRSGAVHILFQTDYARCFYMRSNDDGLTFSKPTEITGTFEAFRSEYDWKVLAPGPGHGIQLTTGRLVVPVWLSSGGKSGYFHHPSVTSVIYSDDEGTTWERGEIAIRSSDEWSDPNESVAVELADGSVMLNVRNESPHQRRLATVSKDGATHWAPAWFVDDLPEPICFGSLIRLPRKYTGSEDCLLFCNPRGLRPIGSAGIWCIREDITVSLSTDEGQTWPIHRLIEPGFAATGYSDLAILPDGTILCLYGVSNNATGRGASLALARFDLSWIMDGRDVVVTTAE